MLIASLLRFFGEFDHESCFDWPARVGQVCVVREGPRVRANHVLGRVVRKRDALLEVSANCLQSAVASCQTTGFQTGICELVASDLLAAR